MVLVEVDLLIAEREGAATAGKDHFPHAQHSRVKLDARVDIRHGEDQMIE